MKLTLIDEPTLVFARGEHVCPRAGISRYDVYDSRAGSPHTRRDRISLGAVGTAESLEKLQTWIRRCGFHIPKKLNNKQPALFPPFPGFHREDGFKAELSLEQSNERGINNSQVKELIGVKNRDDCIKEAVNLYFDKVKFLSENRLVDVIICVIPDELYDKISVKEFSTVESVADDEPLSDDVIESEPIETNRLEWDFRRALKAKCMYLGKPLQLVREASLEPSAKDRQDDATKAWNFCTALYYKANKTVPWRLTDNPTKPSVCYVGIGFYRSRDYQVLNTSLAQVFDEMGSGVILRGSPVLDDKDDRRPYMNYDQAYNLLRRALREYQIAMENVPSRVVLHKTSNFREAELDGFREAKRDMRVESMDFVTIADTPIRAFRSDLYPPFRGTKIELDKETHLLYTKGAVKHYKTYPGLYIPQPLEVRLVECDKSPHVICNEILGLTKMNWNNTQFDGKYPITIQCARKVGQIMKYLTEDDHPNVNYGFYM